MKTSPLFIPAMLVALVAHQAQSQQVIRYNVHGPTSLAWWQIDPNYGHLWASTCPNDPNWQAGEGRSEGARINRGTRKEHVASASNSRVRDIPMYPRVDVHPVCRQAVRGGFITEDTIRWSGVRGEIVVLPDSLDTGLEMRSTYARRAIFETHKFREIRFVVDSLGAVQPGDTVQAVAHGTLQLHGVHRRISAPVKAWREPRGLRVQTQFSFPADDLAKVYQMSKTALAMGTSLGRWNTVHMGVDMIMTR